MSALLERLEALPDEFKEPLRSMVERAAETEALSNRAAAAAQTARAEMDGALAAGDVEAAAVAAARLTGCERVVAELPSPVIERAAAAEVLSLAGQRIADGLIAMPGMPVVAYSAELAAYRSLGGHAVGQLDPPTMLAAEREAQDAVDRLSFERDRLGTWVASWRADAKRDGIDPLALLNAAAVLIEQVKAHCKRTEAVTDQVAEVNQVRRTARLNWTPPSGVMTPEIARMGGHRT